MTVHGFREFLLGLFIRDRASGRSPGSKTKSRSKQSCGEGVLSAETPPTAEEKNAVGKNLQQKPSTVASGRASKLHLQKEAERRFMKRPATPTSSKAPDVGTALGLARR